MKISEKSYTSLTLTHNTLRSAGTKQARLHVDAFVNMLGEDEHSWGLSHKGLLWHGARHKTYIKVATTYHIF